MKSFLKTVIRPLREPASALSQRGYFPDWLRRRLPFTWRLGAFKVYFPGHCSFYYRAAEWDDFGTVLFWNGMTCWEPETLSVFLRLASSARTFVDIGAHTGWFSLLACAVNPEIQVVAFEPAPMIYQALRDNLELNRWTNRCSARNQAVAERCGTAQFHVSEIPMTSSLNPNGFRGYSGTLVDVEVVALDSVFPENRRIDLIKLDVETFEDKVLRGMSRILHSSLPAVIIECLPDGPYREIQQIFGSEEYRFHHLRPEGPVERSEIAPDPGDIYRNWLCVPKSFSW